MYEAIEGQSATPYMKDSVLREEVTESLVYPDLVTFDADNAESFCLNAVRPESLEGNYILLLGSTRLTKIIFYSDNFELDTSTGKLSVVEPFDAEQETEIFVQVSALAKNEKCNKVDEIGNRLKRYLLTNTFQNDI